MKALELQSCRAHRILVVEDEVLFRLMVADALRNVGFAVVEAGSAEEALRILESGELVNLVFSDVRMPGFFAWNVYESGSVAAAVLVAQNR